MQGRAEPFSPLVVAAMLVGGIACFGAFVLLLAFARGPGTQDGGAHALSRSAIGYAGIVELLRSSGTPVLVNRTGELSDAAGTGLLVLTPPPRVRVPDGVVRSVAAEQVLLVLPKWEVEPLEDRPGWVRTTAILPVSAVLSVLPRDLPGATLRRRRGLSTPVLSATEGFDAAIRTGPIDRLQTLTAPGLDPLLRDAEGGTVLATDGRGLFVLSDPELLANAGLWELQAAEGAATLLLHLAEGGTIGFDLSLNGLSRVRDPLRAVLQPPLLGATLCILATFLLVGIAAAVRFGPVQAERRPFALGKLALAANTAALIARARRERMLAAPYAALTQRRAARRLGLRRGMTDAATAQALATMAARRGTATELPALVAEAASVRDRAGLERVALRLYRWRQELLGADR